ncbi:uncharacterized protein LOC130552850 [Triplophysa rosa]|uniref:uncharacterized protein LOC130552850 n=1 Tax=Triplophysa rosa TaxID=992332 RepID=UPI002545E577|nr:uncharacterized protein LOC130552850 [Triplophysa rosa]
MRMNGAFWVLVFLSFCGRTPAEDSPHTQNEIGPYDHDLPTEATTENDAYAADTSLDILKDLSIQVEELQKENRGRVLAVSLKKGRVFLLLYDFNAFIFICHWFFYIFAVQVQAEEIKQLRIRSFNTNIELLTQKALMTEIRTECNDKPKYAFAAALGDGGHVGPSDRESTLVYRKVLTNIGYSYNAASGDFKTFSILGHLRKPVSRSSKNV